MSHKLLPGVSHFEFSSKALLEGDIIKQVQMFRVHTHLHHLVCVCVCVECISPCVLHLHGVKRPGCVDDVTVAVLLTDVCVFCGTDVSVWTCQR